jgi:hypothetical protein
MSDTAEAVFQYGEGVEEDFSIYHSGLRIFHFLAGRQRIKSNLSKRGDKKKGALYGLPRDAPGRGRWIWG